MPTTTDAARQASIPTSSTDPATTIDQAAIVAPSPDWPKLAWAAFAAPRMTVLSNQTVITRMSAAPASAMNVLPALDIAQPQCGPIRMIPTVGADAPPVKGRSGARRQSDREIAHKRNALVDPRRQEPRIHQPLLIPRSNRPRMRHAAARVSDL